MKNREEVGSVESAGPSPLDKEIGDLSLTQALRDFEIANARVIDLTQRLVEASATIAGLREELDVARADMKELKQRHEAMQHSMAFRIASKIWAVRNAFGV
jgi:hypothetical protein